MVISAGLTVTINAVVARAPDWLRADLLSKDGPTRTAAEEALAAMIANAVGAALEGRR